MVTVPNDVNIPLSYSGLGMSEFGRCTFSVQGKTPSLYKFDREEGHSRTDCAFVWRPGIQADLFLYPQCPSWPGM